MDRHAGIEGQLKIVMSVQQAEIMISSTRPLRAINQLLQGKTLEQALALVPLLFNICGTAHNLAALKAASALLKQPIDSELAAACHDVVELETGREHVQRILLDWSAWLGVSLDMALMRQALPLLPTAKQTWFERGKAFQLTSQLKQHAEQRAELKQQWQSFLEEQIFARPLAQFQAFSLDDLQAWIAQSATLPAQALQQLQHQHWGCLGANDVAPEQERSVLTRQAPQPLMKAVLAEYGNGVFSRWVARLLELARGTGEPINQTVQAARGALWHQVVLDANQRIQYYWIHAPTEVNFAQGGVVTAGLKTLCQTQCSAELLKAQADLWIQAVDPCVSYQLEIHYA